MASSSGNSSGSPPVQNSGSDGDLRKRKRMQSNRESARRSRQRKRKQVDDLTVQIAQLKKENGQISSSVGVTTQHCAAVEAENSVLKAQMTELTQRLQSLNEILDYINSGGVGTMFAAAEEFQGYGGDGIGNPWNLGGGFNQPIMASADMFNYC